jgi:hypothetical protein
MPAFPHQRYTFMPDWHVSPCGSDVAALVVLTFHLVQQRDVTARPLAGLAVDFLMEVTSFAVMNHVITGRNDQNDFAYGFGRVMFPFFTGVLLCRFRFPQRMAARASLGLMSGRAAILLVPVTPQVLLAACPTFLCRFRRSLRWARRLSRAEAG